MALKICGMSCVVNLLSGNQFAPVCSDNNGELIMVLVQKSLHISMTVQDRPEICCTILYTKLENFLL